MRVRFKLTPLFLSLSLSQQGTKRPTLCRDAPSSSAWRSGVAKPTQSRLHKNSGALPSIPKVSFGKRACLRVRARSVGRTEGLMRSSCVYKMRDRPRPQPARPSSHAHTHRTRKKAVWGCQGQHSLNGSQLVFLWIKPTKQRDNRPTTATATTITFAPLTPAPAHVLSLSLSHMLRGRAWQLVCLFGVDESSHIRGFLDLQAVAPLAMYK